MLIVAALAFVLADAAARTPHFNPDESRWLSRAHYVAALADPFGETWADRYMTRGQPPLGSYAMGIGLLAHGRDLQTNEPWDFSLTWEQNIALGYKPVPEDLAAGRGLGHGTNDGDGGRDQNPRCRRRGRPGAGLLHRDL